MTFKTVTETDSWGAVMTNRADRRAWPNDIARYAGEAGAKACAKPLADSPWRQHSLRFPPRRAPIAE